MEKQAQISATISTSTKELLDRYVRATGMKRGDLIEQALLHYLQATGNSCSTIVVTRESGELILKMMKSGKPNKALRDLMADGD